MAIARTTSLTKIEQALYEPTFYKIIQGGMSASKTFSILELLVGYAESYPDSLISVVGMSYPHLSTGAIRDFTKIMKETNRWNPAQWNSTSHIYTFKNGSVLEFLSVDKMSARGPRRDVLFVNEANGLSFEVFQELAGRTRDFVIIDYNPSAKFWAHEELIEKHPDDVSFLILTYKDNEALSAREVENIEAHRPKAGEEPSNWWTVYGLGQIGSLEGNVYSGWVESSLEEITKGRLVRYGLDFGFSNDESAMVAVYDMGENRLGVVEKLFEKGILNSQYAEKFNVAQVDPSVLIVADSARPEAIAEIRSNGYRIVGADKNAGSVLRGIERVSEKQIYYVGENLKREYLSYAWRKKRTGEILDEPQDGNDHCLAYDTEIKTLHGNKKIGEMVGTSGWLWTEGRKLRYYRNVRKTGREQVYEIQLDDGTSFKCSGEHIIYTLNRGPVPAYLLNTKDMIQLDTYESRSYKRKEAKIQRSKLLARCKSWILSKRTAQATFDSQGRLGVSQWASAKGSSDRSYRQRQEQQPNRKSSSCSSLSKQQECFRKNNSKETSARRSYKGESESLAFFGGRPKMALGNWQRIVEKEKADRKEMRSLWEKLLYTRLFDFCTLLLWKLQNAGKTKKAQGSARVYAKMRSRKALGVEDVYCMDVFDTSTFALYNGVIVSNCLDALRYAVDDLAVKPVSWAGPR